MRYQIERRLGAGGMAEVFEATALGDAGFRRKVAIKRLVSGRVDDPELRAAMVHEARVAATLHHPGIVAVLDVGEVDGGPMQVLEWVDGLDVSALQARARTAGRPLPLAAALHVVRAVAEALEYAHHARDAAGQLLGLVHRDVKPANVLVSWDGHVRLADFGIAFTRDREERTKTGVAKGTLGFMAPEQLRGGAVDARTDVYALGALLHAVVVGRSPVDPDAAPIDVLGGGGLRLDPSLPAPVRDVVERALASEPRDRFVSALAMVAALDEARAALGLDDGIATLRRWLGELRGAPARGALLDELAQLDLEIVAAPPRADAPPDVPQYTMQRAARAEASDRVESPTVASGRGLRARSPAPPRRRWPWVAGLAVGVGVLGSVAVLWPRAPAPPGPASPDQASPPSVAVVVDARPRAPAVAVAPPDAAPVLDARPPELLDARRRTHEAPAAPPPPPPATVVEQGVIKVPAAGVEQAQVLVDGRARGHVPLELSLPVGPHRVELVLRDGTRRGPTAIVVEARHTRSAALKVTFAP